MTPLSNVEPTATENDAPFVQRSLRAKFRTAFRGLKRGVRGESNFFFHFFAGAIAIAAGLVFRISAGEWCWVAACITAVLAAEMLNTAIEALAKAVSREYHPRVADALDIAAAGVLLVGIGAAVIGAIIFVPHLLPLIGQ